MHADEQDATTAIIVFLAALAILIAFSVGVMYGAGHAGH